MHCTLLFDFFSYSAIVANVRCCQGKSISKHLLFICSQTTNLTSVPLVAEKQVNTNIASLNALKMLFALPQLFYSADIPHIFYPSASLSKTWRKCWNTKCYHSYQTRYYSTTLAGYLLCKWYILQDVRHSCTRCQYFSWHGRTFIYSYTLHFTVYNL